MGEPPAVLLRHSPGWRRAIRAGAGLAYLFLYLPLAVLMLFSFSEARTLSYPITGLTLKWYGELWRDREVIDSIVNSLIVAAAVVPLSVTLGGLTALAVDRFLFPGRVAYERGVLLPLMVPGLVTGLSILLFVKQFAVPLSLLTVVLGHAIAWMPIAAAQLLARLRRLDRRLEEASMDLGAGRFETFRRITLPNLRTAILGSALLVFTLSFDEVAITFFLTGKENTLPMKIWSMLRTGITPEINAVATLTIALSVVLILASVRLLQRDR